MDSNEQSKARKSGILVRQLFSFANVSDYTHHFYDMPAHMPAVLFVRLSSDAKGARLKLKRHTAILSAGCASRGTRIAEIHAGVESGWFTPRGRPLLDKAIMSAKQHGAFILTTDSTRLLRPYKFRHQKRRKQRFRTLTKEWETLTRYFEGVQLATLHDPRSSGITEFQKKLNAPGFRKSIREQLLPQVLELHAGDYSIRMIADELNLNRETVRRWCQ